MLFALVKTNERNRKSGKCGAAARLEQSGGVPVDGFGSSDCKCKNHLMYFNNVNNFEDFFPEESKIIGAP